MADVFDRYAARAAQAESQIEVLIKVDLVEDVWKVEINRFEPDMGEGSGDRSNSLLLYCTGESIILSVLGLNLSYV